MYLPRVALLLLLVPSASNASDRLNQGPVPAWVKRQSVPKLPTPDEKPTRILLSDQQTRFDKDGSVHRFTEAAIHIQKSEGLAAGTIAFPWRPEMDDVTIHELKLLRGDKVIDVLASGKSFTILRRETDLEAAKLDGVLTATLQIDGVEVGDTILLAATTVSRDPVFGRHAETVTGNWNGISIEKAHFRMEWPSGTGLRLRSEGSIQVPAVRKGPGTDSVELDLSKIEPEILPEGAPARFRQGRYVEATDFKDWSDIAELLGPLFVKASKIGPAGPLREEVRRIQAESTDPVRRTEAALRLTQDRIRYVAIQMGANGLVPADAEATWASRYGDCKAKTALLLALLGELGVKAEPVVVSSTGGDGMDRRLPMVSQFDHVLVLAVVGGKTYWLDGTRTGDSSLALLETPDYRWGLPLTTGARLLAVRPEPPSRPIEERTLKIDARSGVRAPAPATAEIVYRGDSAKLLNMALNNIGGDVRNQALQEFWKQRLDDIEPDKVSAQYDAATASLRFSLEGKVKLDWSDGFWRVPWSKSGFKADFNRLAGPNREAPYQLEYPSYTKVTTTIRMPEGITLTSGDGPATVDQILAGVHYQRRAVLANGVLTVERSEKSLQPEVSYAEARGAQAALRALDKTDLYLQLTNYRSTEADVKARGDSVPVGSKGYVDRGLMFLDNQQFDEAVADFTRAHELDPKSPWPLANRGLAYAWKNDPVRAKADFAAVRSISPGNPVLLRGTALIALRSGDLKEGVRLLTSALAQDPNDSWTLRMRAEAYRQLAEYPSALADTDKLLALSSTKTWVRLLRANIYRAQGDKARAIAEANTLATENPEDTETLVTAGMILSAYGDRAGAMKLLDQALAIEPESFIYLNRYRVRESSDVAGRQADLAEALKLDPTSVDALAMQGGFFSKQGRHAEAVASYTEAVKLEPESFTLKLQRGIAYARAGNSKAASADFEAARKGASEAGEYNNICWTKATAGVDLEGALKDCDKALELAPDSPAYLDSRGLVLLRLGRPDEAIAAYDKALAKAPKQSSSLYGRALAYARKGDAAKAAADRKSASAENPRVAEEYEGYGLTLP